MKDKLIVKINITDEEKSATVKLITKLSKISEVISIQAMSYMLDINVNRLRYIVDELLAEGVLEKIPVGIFKPNYKRYTYKVLDSKKYKGSAKVGRK